MAEIVAPLLVQQLRDILAEGNRLFGGLSDDLQSLQGEFERMSAFLRDANVEEDKDTENVWVKQVREIAYETEDLLDEYELHFSTQRGRVQMIFCFIKILRARSRLATKIKSIKSRVHELSEGHKRYLERYEAEDQSRRRFTVVNHSVVDGRGAALLQDEVDLVGMQVRKDKLISLLLDGDSKLKVIPVIGMGGLGKTTLVKKVYEDKGVKSQFQSHAWVTVSATLKKNLFKTMIEQFYGEMKEPVPQEVQSMEDNELKEYIKEFLKERKYIIVFDDVWSVNQWEGIKYALSNCSSHSRVLLTTRSKDVAMASRTGFKVIYDMEFLSPEESWILFCKKVFKDQDFPPELKDISERILSKCGGLPLAIVAVGGLLASKDKVRLDDWEKIYRGFGAELEGEGMLDRVNRILLLSFLNLPYNLKVCLLYLSIFPEDHRISCNQVIRLWIAEGFVEEIEGFTMEEVGESYVHKLVNASLLQVAETTLDGRLRTCTVHDILREIILRRSRRENLVTIINEKVTKLPKNLRRVTIHGPLENTNESNILKHLRSLILLSPEHIPSMSVLSKMLCGGSRILKILDLRGASLEVIPNEVFKLYLLEYLSLRSTKVKVIPKSIGKLRKLETLDLKNTFVTKLPVEILNLKKLCYLVAHRYTFGLKKDHRMNRWVSTFQAPCNIGCLVSLQKLCYIDADEKDGVKIVKEIGKLTQLRRLGIRMLRKEDGKDLCSSLESLTNLRSLSIVSIGDEEILDVQYNISSTLNLLRTLEINGRLEKMPQWIPSLQSLTWVNLQETKLKEEPLQYLEDLPNLTKLLLHDAYEGEELHFKAGKFQCLQSLDLTDLEGLRRVRIEKGSIPCLKELGFVDIKLMEELPSGIEHLSNLQYFVLVNVSDKLIRSVKDPKYRISTQAKIIDANLNYDQIEWLRLEA